MHRGEKRSLGEPPSALAPLARPGVQDAEWSHSRRGVGRGEAEEERALPLNFSMLARSALNDPAGFLVQVRAPLLIWETPPAQAHELAWVTQPGMAPERSSASEPLIFELRKGVHARPSGLGFGVTVGRAANNDIMLDDPTVSRFHAAFQQEQRTGVWHLQDAESQNGTFVDEARVDARIPAPLANGTRLRFGEVKVLFLLPEAFRPWVLARTAPAGE